MSTKEAHAVDVDIDPGWYPGQPELEEEEAQQYQQQGRRSTGDGGGAGSSISHSPSTAVPNGDSPLRSPDGAAAGAEPLIPRPPVAVPTVLTKLQKWGDYESVGDQVQPTKFIPMKTPLSAEILDSWSLPSQPKHRLTVPEMVAQQAALGRKVGLLLDLSNHDCLYTADIPPDLRYTHVQLVAKELPPPEFVDAVVAVVNKFWRAHPDEYIAVHCAYGFNRTGFVVCCYLIEVCGLSVEAALETFAESRPPGVKHEQFRAELHRRYNFPHGSVSGSGGGAYGVYGSPDDNSSFGCSPSCASLDLRDMGLGGPSPLPLTRGSTFDCFGGPGGCSVGGVSPRMHRTSLDGHGHGTHQTLTFTTSYNGIGWEREFRRSGCGSAGGGGGVGGVGGGSTGGILKPWQQQPQQQQQLQEGQQRQPQGQGQDDEQEQEQDRSGPLHVGVSAAALTAVAVVAGCSRQGQVSECPAAAASGPGAADAAEPITAAATAAIAMSALAVGPSARGMYDSSDEAETSYSCNENESLGLNDRIILQTMRQHALRHSAIPEEAASSHSTLIGGCSTGSLADMDNVTGHNTPRGTGLPSRYSHKSLDTIDWAAAIGEQLGDGTGNNVGGSCAGPPAEGMAALKLG